MAKSIIIYQNIRNPLIMESWGSLVELCKAHSLPYHSLKGKRFPFNHDGYRIVKTSHKQLINI